MNALFDAMSSSPHDLEKRIVILFDRMFDGPPAVDTGDWLDGASLELISGKSYRELVPLLSEELDSFPLFSLVEQEVGRYYLGSMLLHLVEGLGRAESWKGKYRWLYEAYCIIGATYLSMISFLEAEETLCWIRSEKELSRLICDVFAAMMESFADLDESNWNRVRQVVSALQMNG